MTWSHALFGPRLIIFNEIRQKKVFLQLVQEKLEE